MEKYDPSWSPEQKMAWRKEMDQYYSGKVVADEKKQKLELEARRAVQKEEAATSEEELRVAVEKMKSPPLSPWHQHIKDTELEGQDLRNPETVVMDGERRTDEEVGR